MAFGAGKNGQFTLDSAAGSPVDLSTYINKAGMGLKVEMLDTTTFGASAHTRIPGLKDGDKITIGGLVDPTLYNHFAAIWTAGGGLTAANASLSFVYGPMGTTTGNPKNTGECFMSGFSPATSVGDAVMWDAELTVTGDVTLTTY